MVVIILRINVPLQKRSLVTALFDSYRGPVSVQTECRSVDLYSHLPAPGSFVLVEEWTSLDAVQRHIQSASFLKVLAIMDLAAEQPDLKIYTVSSVQGFELVEEMRRDVSGEATG